MEMKLYGDKETGFFLTIEDDGIHTGSRPHLEPCPFCGRWDQLTINNTHTPSFWVECECGAQQHGHYPRFRHPIRTERTCRTIYQKALDSAVCEWNRRA